MEVQFRGRVYGEPDGCKVFVTIDGDTYTRLAAAIASYGGKKPLFSGNKCEVRFDGLQPSFSPEITYEFDIRVRKYNPPRAALSTSSPRTTDEAGQSVSGFVKFTVLRVRPL